MGNSCIPDNSEINTGNKHLGIYGFKKEVNKSK